MEWIKKITQTNLFKITSLNSVSILIKIGIGLVTSKLLAVFVGPTGMALVGNLRNFLTSLESISTLGFQNGIVKYVAECKGDIGQIQKIFSTVFICLLFVALFLSGVLYFLASFWNEQIFGSHFEFEIIFRAMALALPWFAISVFLLAVINGMGKFAAVIWINIIGNLIGLAVSICMILQYRTLGALFSIVISPALLFFVTYYFISKEFHFSKNIQFYYFDFIVLKNLSSYSLMALFSSVFGPLVFLAIRKNVILVAGIDQAGFWETMTRFSTYYMLFISSIVTVYFYPKLALAKNNSETKIVFWSFYKNILPLFITGLIMVYFSRNVLIELIFTSEFLPVSELFFWQLIGDILKVASLILGFQFYAKKMTVAFIITESVSLGILYFSSIYLLEIFGIQGIVMAQALDNCIYFLVLVLFFRKSLFL